MDRDAESVLITWGRWSRDNPGLLISSRGVIGRCMDEGAGASQISLKPQISMPQVVELCEDIVLSMGQDIKDAVILKFVLRHTIRDGCRIVHCSSREFFDRINMGISFTEGWLKAIEK